MKLICTVYILSPQETEGAVQAKQLDVERLLSKGQHLYQEKPSTQPVKVMKQPLTICITHNGLYVSCCTLYIDKVYV